MENKIELGRFFESLTSATTVVFVAYKAQREVELIKEEFSMLAEDAVTIIESDMEMRRRNSSLLDKHFIFIIETFDDDILRHLQNAHVYGLPLVAELLATTAAIYVPINTPILSSAFAGLKLCFSDEFDPEFEHDDKPRIEKFVRWMQGEVQEQVHGASFMIACRVTSILEDGSFTRRRISTTVGGKFWHAVENEIPIYHFSWVNVVMNTISLHPRYGNMKANDKIFDDCVLKPFEGLKIFGRFIGAPNLKGEVKALVLKNGGKYLDDEAMTQGGPNPKDVEDPRSRLPSSIDIILIDSTIHPSNIYATMAIKTAKRYNKPLLTEHWIVESVQQKNAQPFSAYIFRELTTERSNESSILSRGSSFGQSINVDLQSSQRPLDYSGGVSFGAGDVIQEQSVENEESSEYEEDDESTLFNEENGNGSEDESHSEHAESNDSEDDESTLRNAEEDDERAEEEEYQVDPVQSYPFDCGFKDCQSAPFNSKTEVRDHRINEHKMGLAYLCSCGLIATGPTRIAKHLKAVKEHTYELRRFVMELKRERGYPNYMFKHMPKQVIIKTRNAARYEQCASQLINIKQYVSKNIAKMARNQEIYFRLVDEKNLEIESSEELE